MKERRRDAHTHTHTHTPVLGADAHGAQCVEAATGLEAASLFLLTLVLISAVDVSRLGELAVKCKLESAEMLKRDRCL